MLYPSIVVLPFISAVGFHKPAFAWERYSYRVHTSTQYLAVSLYEKQS